MTELTDVFSDEGIDGETMGFLVEALANSDEADWPDILEPFVPPEKTLGVLAAVPGVLDRTLAWLAGEEAKRQELGNTASMFLDALDMAMLAHGSCSCLARWSRLCRASRKSVARGQVWEGRARAAFSLCGLRPPPGKLVDWRAVFFQPMRPRLDGVYVGECSYDHFIPFGSSSDLRKNAQEVNVKGRKGAGYDVRYDYRRYVRFCPPDTQDAQLRALVLQDAGPRELVLEVLRGIDPCRHVNPQKQETVKHEAKEVTRNTLDEAAEMASRVCAGCYRVLPSESCVEVKYSTGEGVYSLTFNVLPGRPGQFCAQLEWRDYVLTKASGEALPYQLGRKFYRDGSRVEGAPPADEKRDHFASMDLGLVTQLEHLF